jgi:hypothetical protein
VKDILQLLLSVADIGIHHLSSPLAFRAHTIGVFFYLELKWEVPRIYVCQAQSDVDQLCLQLGNRAERGEWQLARLILKIHNSF